MFSVVELTFNKVAETESLRRYKVAIIENEASVLNIQRHEVKKVTAPTYSNVVEVELDRRKSLPKTKPVSKKKPVVLEFKPEVRIEDTLIAPMPYKPKIVVTPHKK